LERWERREKKLEGKRSRMEKHGRSILTAISSAEKRKEEALRQRAAKRASRNKRKR